MNSHRITCLLIVVGWFTAAESIAVEPATNPGGDQAGETDRVAQMFVDYFGQMSTPKPLKVRTGEEFETHRRQLRQKLRECINPDPLPQRIPLDVRESNTLTHPWCTVRRVYYQIWPGVYADGLLYMPRNFPKKPAPAVLCPHGYWPFDNAWPDVQWRCLALAQKGYGAALDAAARMPAIDTSRVTLISRGSGPLAVAALFSAILDERIQSVDLDLDNYRLADRGHPWARFVPSFIFRYGDVPAWAAVLANRDVKLRNVNDVDHDLMRTREIFNAVGKPGVLTIDGQEQKQSHKSTESMIYVPQQRSVASSSWCMLGGSGLFRGTRPSTT